MSVKGDFGGIKRVQTKIANASDLIRSGEMSQVLAETARGLVDLGFETGTDPGGGAWAPLSERDGQPLRDTRRLQSSFTYETTPEGFEVGTNVEYAATHQFGAVIKPVNAKALAWKTRGGTKHFAQRVVIPKRPMLPNDPLPDRWEKALTEAANDAMRETVGE